MTKIPFCRVAYRIDQANKSDPTLALIRRSCTAPSRSTRISFDTVSFPRIAFHTDLNKL
jgi:hypothetical protein